MEISRKYNQSYMQTSVTKSNAFESDVFKPAFTSEVIPLAPHLRRKRMKPWLELLGYVALIVVPSLLAGLIVSSNHGG